MTTLLFALALTQGAPNAKISADFREVTNRAAFMKSVPLTAAHKAMLQKNLFVQSPTQDIILYSAYGMNDYENVPSLLTSDNVLQLLHIFFDSTLRTAEEKSLFPEAKSLTRMMLAKANKRYRALKGTPLEAAALKNVVYFGVASNLFGLGGEIDPDARETVSEEMANIEAHGGFKKMSVFPYSLDYSQFVVRGHYSKSPDLGKYFMGMMWYGLTPIGIAKRLDQSIEPLPDLVRAATLMAFDLDDPQVEAQWNKIYGLTSLYAGKANRLLPSEWRQITRSVLGPNPDLAKALLDDANVQKLADKAAAFRAPSIKTKKNDQEIADDVQLRFMGQRAIPDSVMMNEVTDPDGRPFPNPLDVMAMLGSDRAAKILDASPAAYNPKGWASYVPRREALKSVFAAYPAETWAQDFYWGWLDSLRQGWQLPTGNVPSFMKTTAWQDHQLNSALASWAELRHDTILYGEQTVSEMGGDDPDGPWKGYVEPNVAQYTRLKKLVTQMRDSLRARGYLMKEQSEQFTNFLDFLNFLIDVSKKELAGVKLTAKEHTRIRKVEGEIEALNTSIQIIGSNFQQLRSEDLDIAQIADVHTANDTAMEVGVGRADDVIAIVPIEGKLVFARGTALSYYEFLVPSSQRMTDETWRAMLDKNPPKRPSWTKSFFVNTKARPKDE
jgi:hypothetical protein